MKKREGYSSLFIIREIVCGKNKWVSVPSPYV